MCRVFGHACTSGPTCWSGWITTPSNERTIEGAVKVSDHELPRWVTIKQAAEFYQLDPKTIRRMIAHGKLRARRVGERSIRVDRESVRRLIADGELTGYFIGRGHRMLRVDLDEIDGKLVRPIGFHWNDPSAKPREGPLTKLAVPPSPGQRVRSLVERGASKICST